MKRLNPLFRLRILFLIPFWNSCTLSGGGDGHPPYYQTFNPKNIVTVADSGQVSISWQSTVPEYYNTPGYGYYAVFYKVGKDSLVGCLESGNGGCTAGCEILPITQTSCIVTGLSNDTSYVFTVVANTITTPHGYNISYANSSPVTPKTK